MPPAQVAKNTLVVGAIDDIIIDPYNNSNVSQFNTDFSSWGPTDDGRIKPDVVGNGELLYSSGANSDQQYYLDSGTSMSAPNVTGTAALLIEHYENLFDVQPYSATTKGLLIHTAFDAGNTGPDYEYGWGVVDGTAAAEFLTNASNSGSSDWLRETTYYSEATFRATVLADGTEPIKATIVWTDPAPEKLPGNGLDDNTSVTNTNNKITVEGGERRLRLFKAE